MYGDQGVNNPLFIGIMYYTVQFIYLTFLLIMSLNVPYEFTHYIIHHYSIIKNHVYSIYLNMVDVGKSL